MAGPQTVQTFPAGLLDMLGMKGTGKAPSEIDGNLRASVELLQLYLEQSMQRAHLSTGVVAAPGFSGATGTSAIVPDGHLWLVRSITTYTTAMAAGEAYRVRLGFQTAFLGPWFLFGDTVAAAAGVTDRIAFGWLMWPPFVMYPGDIPGIVAELVTAGAHTFSIDIEYYDLLQ